MKINTKTLIIFAALAVAAYVIWRKMKETGTTPDTKKPDKPATPYMPGKVSPPIKPDFPKNKKTTEKSIFNEMETKPQR